MLENKINFTPKNVFLSSSEHNHLALVDLVNGVVESQAGVISFSEMLPYLAAVQKKHALS